MLRHYDLVIQRFGTHRGTMLMRKFACCYAQNKHGARHFRTHVGKVETPEQFYQVVEEYFPKYVDPAGPLDDSGETTEDCSSDTCSE
jgi:tRNA-dihydrouridine synthase B